MLPLLSPLYKIRDPAAILIRDACTNLVNKEDGGMPVHASSVSALRPCFPPHWVFPGGKVRPGRAADHSPPSSAAVMEK